MSFRCPRCNADLTWRGEDSPDWETRTRAMDWHISEKHTGSEVASVRREFLLTEANVPRRYRHPPPPPTTDAPGWAAWDDVLAWLGNGNGNLILYGPPGTGKTTLAAQALAHEFDTYADPRFALTEVEETYWLHVGDFVRRARGLVATGRSGELALDTDKARRAFWLVIDDLGAERLTEFARDVIADLVESRYDAELPTAVTSNYAPDELAERLGEGDPVVGDRLVGRLCEGAIQVLVGGPDRRLPNVTYLPTPRTGDQPLPTGTEGTANP